MILISLTITIIYLLLVGSFIFGFDKVSIFKLKDIPAKTKFSVVIPFRNEAENLPDLLDTIATLNYPKHLFEIILVDDASVDDSVEIIQKVLDSKQGGFDFDKPEIVVISNERKTNSPKKDAITSAIKISKYDWIITTDADCQLPLFWLDSFDEYIQKSNAVCIAAPVTYSNTSSFLNRFQILDLLSLQGATIGGFGLKKPFLCNGANLAYKKRIFKEVNGFEGNNNIASGDDIFLLEKITKKYPQQLQYLKCAQAIISTKPQPTWRNLMSQRIRWAAKTSAYNNGLGKLTGLVVLLMNALILIGLVLSIIGVINFKTFFYIIFIKFNIDFFLIYKSASFFNQKEILKSYILGFLFYPIFSVYIACISSFYGYKWKGRDFKK
ncbi:MAG: glycosyltransferase [Algibacter sp.]|uniref:glycosyltransferase family 2 protein n=1 Tax=Algibacter sp. TaxID=1872428 RepID=UPI0026146AB1|nr:glycosyltransferase [Algibacter sp.]MDG1728308.1 glycosyltransferase [Algibacter sp.]MDG2178266.1 glycosyltransferase [Algibacter sp.]